MRRTKAQSTANTRPPAREAILLALSGFACFLSMWTVVPAPARLLLPLAVGAPELAAWLAGFALLLFLLTVLRASRSGVGRAASAAAIVAFILAVHPLIRLPATARRFAAALPAALGADYLSRVPSDVISRMRTAPVVFGDLFRGLPANDARVVRAIPFASLNGHTLTLDVYAPNASTPPSLHPAVVQIYGGAWQRGAPGDNAGFARYLAARGYIVFAIDHRHAPQSTWPAQLIDVRAALAWIQLHGAEYGADPTRIALIGRSSGAHLALMAAYTASNPAIRGVVSYYGPVDLEEGYLHPPRPDPLNVRSIEETLLGGRPDAVQGRYREASPITHVTHGMPPTLLVYGARDHIVEARFGRMLDERLRASANVSVLLEIPWAEHAFDAIEYGPSAQLALYHTERFLAWALYR